MGVQVEDGRLFLSVFDIPRQRPGENGSLAFDLALRTIGTMSPPKHPLRPGR